MYIHVFAEFYCLLEGEIPPIPPNEDDIMISGEGIAQLSLPPPDSCVVTAQVEGTTLTRAQYTRIASLMSFQLRLPTRALEYVGHTLHPLTLYWHCSAAERGESDNEYELPILNAIVQEGIVQINLGKKQDVMPQKNVSKRSDKERLRTYFIHILCMATCTYVCSEVLVIVSYINTHLQPCMQCYIPLLYISLYHTGNTANLQPALYRKSL